jgi:hypothetical protein
MAAESPRYDWTAWRLPASILGGVGIIATVIGILLTVQTSRFTAIVAAPVS